MFIIQFVVVNRERSKIFIIQFVVVNRELSGIFIIHNSNKTH